MKDFGMYNLQFLQSRSWISGPIMPSCQGKGVFSDALVPILMGWVFSDVVWVVSGVTKTIRAFLIQSQSQSDTHRPSAGPLRNSWFKEEVFPTH